MKNSTYKITLTLFLLVSVIDLLIGSNVAARIFLNILVSIITFQLGVSKFKLDKPKSMMLLSINIIIFLLSYKYRFYLFNIMILSLLLWRVITPRISKSKHAINLAALTILISISIIYIAGINIPIFFLVFYPIYLFGFNIENIKFKGSKAEFMTLSIGVIFSASAIFVFLFKTRDYFIFDNISFLNPCTSNINAALIFPFIIFFHLLLTFSINSLLYKYTGIFSIYPHAETDAPYYIHSIIKRVYSFIMVFIIVGGMVFLSELLIYKNVISALRILFTPQAIFNIMLLTSIYLTFISLVGRGLSTLIFCIICVLLLLGNYIKLTFFNEPFYPWDIYLIRSGLMISRSYISLKLIVAIFFILITSTAAVLKYRSRLKKILKPKPTLLLIPFSVSLIIINLIIINTPKYLSDINMGKSWYIGRDGIVKNGIFTQTLFYLTDLDKYIFRKPPEYSNKKMHEINDELSNKYSIEANASDGNASMSNKTLKPNIVVIMSESFWDPTQFKDVSFNKDIIENLRKYEKGHLISPVFGGGTANTEFEALTGLSNYFLNPGVIPYNVYINRTTPSLASVLKDDGYDTIAIHPNYESFYNRKKVYSNFGFDKLIDINYFNKATDYKGNFVSDDKLADKILTTLNTNSAPKFIFAVSIQNHDPYYNSYKNTEIKASSNKLDNIDLSILSNYGQNIYDADKALGKLIDNLKLASTPTLVYFFGDHLPRLGEPKGIYDLYNELDYFKGSKNMYKDIHLYETPFVKWANYKVMKELDKDISPAQIPYEILNDSKLAFPSYFNILDDLRNKYPYLSNRIAQSVDINEQVIKDYKLIEYDLLFGEQYLKKMD